MLLGDRTAVRAGDGTLWFVTSRGLSVVDPESLAPARPSPHVTIDDIRADDRHVSGASLTAGTRKVEIDYTAPELTYPLKTRFRYRLEGSTLTGSTRARDARCFTPTCHRAATRSGSR